MCFSLVPRHSASFPSLPVLKATGSCKHREAASNGKLQATGSCKRREAASDGKLQATGSWASAWERGCIGVFIDAICGCYYQNRCLNSWSACLVCVLIIPVFQGISVYVQPF